MVDTSVKITHGVSTLVSALYRARIVRGFSTSPLGALSSTSTTNSSGALSWRLMSALLKPSDFLARARAGHCGTTSDDGDCTIGESGSFDRVTKLMRHTKMRDERCKDERNNPWHTLTCSKRLDPTPQMMKQAMRSCLSACDSCARCNYVSFSWHFEDCACPMALNRARAI